MTIPRGVHEAEAACGAAGTSRRDGPGEIALVAPSFHDFPRSAVRRLEDECAENTMASAGSSVRAVCEKPEAPSRHRLEPQQYDREDQLCLR